MSEKQSETVTGGELVEEQTRDRTAELEKIRHLMEIGGQAAVEEYFIEAAKLRDERKRQSTRRENKEFVQVYAKGWQRLQQLMKEDKNAARFYAFLAEKMGPDGTLAASRATLAEALETSERTISRHARKLEELGAIIILKLGTANVYCLDSDEVWKSFDSAKPYAPFNTRTLVGKKENRFVKKRLATIMKGKLPEQRDWVEDIEAADEEDYQEHVDKHAEALFRFELAEAEAAAAKQEVSI